MKYILALSTLLFTWLLSSASFAAAAAAATAKNCLETSKLEAGSVDGLAFAALAEMQDKGWLPVKGKTLTADFDQNEKNDFAYFLKKDSEVRVYVIWDGDRIMKGQCHSDLIAPTQIKELIDDPCKFKIESIKNKTEVGISIRPFENVKYKYFCRKFDADPSERIWVNTGTPD